tara:strand:+ start:103 stop:474 length:372 start_codon:yes stop_codon:yes gene_type:complete
MNIIKQIFYLANISIFILYLSPCSLLGYLINKDCKLQPRITEDLIVSTNHVIAFTLLSLIGLISFKKNLKQVSIYLIFISIFLELCHLFIPERGFQISDLFGNITGVILSYLIFKIIYKGVQQ